MVGEVRFELTLFKHRGLGDYPVADTPKNWCFLSSGHRTSRSCTGRLVYRLGGRLGYA